MNGIAVLVASILRRDRVRITAWGAALVGLIAYSMISFKSLYESESELTGYADVVFGSAASRAFSGPGYGLTDPTMGAVLANETVSFLAAGIALMSIFMITRNTRAEEEDGRAELLAATEVGRHARSAAALAAVGAVNAAIGVSIAVVLAAGGLDPLGSILLGLAVAGCGVVFAALALLTAQLSAHARVGSAIAGAALGSAYLVRALGDISSQNGEGGGLSWLSPIGWAQAVRPFADERVWPLLLSLAVAALLVAVAVVLERRRDLGGGMIEARPGPARGRPYMARFFGLPLRLQRTALVFWLVGALVLGFTYGTVANDIEQMIADNPQFADYLTQSEGSLIDSYFATVLMILALVGTGYMIQSLLRIRGEESSGRAEALLTTGLSRTRWALGHVAVTFLGLALILPTGGGALGFGYLTVGGDPAELPALALAALAWLPAVLVATGLVGLLIGYLPRLAQIAWGLLALFAFIAFFGDPLNLPAWLSDISPFSHVPELPAASFSSAPLLSLTAIALLLSALALQGLRRRDIG